MAYKQRIKLIVSTGSSTSTSEIKAPNVTDAMFDAAWDLIYTMSTGKRRAPKARFKKYREQNEREAAKARVAKATKKAERKKRMRIAQLNRRANRDTVGTGIHAMVEGNRSDEQT
jgi:hypothetical protein